MSATADILVLHTANLGPWPGEGFEAALRRLPPALAMEVMARRRWQDRQARLQARLLLARGLAELGLSPGLEAWTRAPQGKPLLAGAGVAFSISHTEGMTICALSRHCELGVDVEVVQEVDPAEFEGFFTPAEMAHIRAGRPPWRTLLGLWTAKEAVLKADGRGLLAEPRLLEVLGPRPSLDGRAWCLAALNLGSGHLCHLACELERPRARLKAVAWEELTAPSA